MRYLRLALLLILRIISSDLMYYIMCYNTSKVDSMNGRYSLNLPVDLKQDAEQMAERQGISLEPIVPGRL